MPDNISPETQALQAALEAAQRDRDIERNRRIETEGALRTETGNRFAAQETSVQSAIDQIEAHATLLQQKWTSLQQEGNFEEAGKAMREMSDASARLSNLRAQKDYIERQKAAVAATPPTTDPLERFNSTERDWIARNPSYLSDQGFQRKVHAAATYAVEHEGIVKDTPAYWQYIEGKVYPGRQQTQQQPVQQTDLSGDPGIQIDNSEPAPAAEDTADISLDTHHTRNALPSINPTVDPPAMHLDLRPEQPQQRATSGDGSGMRAAAAPPSRRMAEISRQRAPNGRIEPTPLEYETALQLYSDIVLSGTNDPNVDTSPEAAVRWYHAYYSDPKFHRGRRREQWVFDGRAA